MRCTILLTAAAALVGSAVAQPVDAEKRGAPAPASGSGSQTYQTAVVNVHNKYRKIHSAPDLKWDAKLASEAQQIASSCKFEHSKAAGDGNYGQNIQAGTSPDKVADVIDGMYKGEEPKFRPYYGQANPPNFMEWGHFSQIVWKDTTKVGCATQSCPGGVALAPGTKYFTVCNYASPGNFGGQYAKNVARPSGGK